MQYKKKIFIIAGEVSGDQLGGILLSKLKKSSKTIIYYGIGGKKLSELGLKSIFPISNITVNVFTFSYV